MYSKWKLSGNGGFRWHCCTYTAIKVIERYFMKKDQVMGGLLERKFKKILEQKIKTTYEYLIPVSKKN